MVPSGTSIRLLSAAAFILISITASAQTPPAPAVSPPAQILPGGNAANPYSGSVPEAFTSGRKPLSLQDAMDLGLKHNLGVLLSQAESQAAQGQRWQELSALLPQVKAEPYVAESKVNVNELGFTGLASLLHISSSVGPYSYFDARVAVSQTLFDWKSMNAARAAGQNLKSSGFAMADARDLVILTVGYVYFQAVADEARIATDEAQVETAQALFNQATDRANAGTAADIDALRAQVELKTRQQRLIQDKNDFAVQKIVVARAIGLAVNQDFDLTDKSLYQPLEDLSIDDALARAYASRSDYLGAESAVRAAQYTRQAAAAGYLPSLSLTADYGTGGAHPSNSTEVYDVRGTLSIPVFTGGSVRGDVQQADAQLQQSRERLENLRAQIEADVRTAVLTLQSSAEQVNVARSNIDLADQTLVQSRDRFSSGVADSVEVVQSQEAVANAHDQYIDSLYSFNYAKMLLVRALGAGTQGVRDYFPGK